MNNDYIGKKYSGFNDDELRCLYSYFCSGLPSGVRAASFEEWKAVKLANEKLGEEGAQQDCQQVRADIKQLVYGAKELSEWEALLQRELQEARLEIKKHKEKCEILEFLNEKQREMVDRYLLIFEEYKQIIKSLRENK